MTAAHALDDKQPRRAHRAKSGMGLFVTDQELIEYLGVPADTARPVLAHLDSSRSGFPKKNPLWGNRRYLPAVRQWLDLNNGLNSQKG